MIRFTRRAALAAASAAALPLARPAFAQAWPQRDLRLIVPFPPGGTTDVAARLVAAAMRERIGRSVVVENVAGAGGTVGATRFVREGDDHALFLSQIASNAIAPALIRDLRYDPEADFRPIGLLVTVPNVWLANPGRLGANRDVRSFLRAARGSAGNGTSTHLTGELVSQLAGLRMVHVPYRGAAPAMTAVVSGEIDALMDNLPTALPQVRAGSVVALAVTSRQRVPELPDVPALAELGAEFGLEGFESEAWFGLSAHRTLSDAGLRRIAQAFQATLADPELRRQLAERGTTPQGGPPEAYAALIRTERERWARVVREGNIQAD
jgi:tripartite-type tricarboxylate transporter receptor subunit TctC